MRLSGLLVALGLLAAPAQAQCINIDFGDAFGTPSSTYGAASGQAGVWQTITPALGTSFPLVDVTGAPTGATVKFKWGPLATVGIGGRDEAPTGEDEKLMDDWWSLNGNDYSLLFRVSFEGLEPGLYRVYSYAWWDDGNTELVMTELQRGRAGYTPCGSGTWPGHQFLAGRSYPGGALVPGSYVVDAATSFDGQLRIDHQSLSFPGCFNGLQLVKEGGCANALYTPYCTQVPVGGCDPVVVAGGLPSAGNLEDFEVLVVGAPNDREGIAYFSTNGRTSVPWKTTSAFQCVQPPLQRAATLNSGAPFNACFGQFRFDFNDWMEQNAAHAPPAGSQVQLQLWFHDPLGAGTSEGLSGALEFTVGP